MLEVQGTVLVYQVVYHYHSLNSYFVKSLCDVPSVRSSIGKFEKQVAEEKSPRPFMRYHTLLIFGISIFVKPAM